MYEFDRKDPLGYFKTLCIVLLVFVVSYATAYFLFGSPFSIPDGPCFALILVWVLGHVGGFIAVQCRIPALLGMLIIGAIFQNLPGEILHAYKHSWVSKIKALGLATILMRAGLKIDYVKAFRRSALTVMLLGIVPVLIEGFLDSSIFATVYGMPFLMAAMAGFLLAPISPTVLVTGMLDLQHKGYGADKSIPSIEMAAAGVDVVAGIAMFAIFESLAMQQAAGTNNAWDLARGPASIGLGAAASAICGVLCGCTKLFKTPWARTTMVFALAQMVMFIYYAYQMPGGGALASIGVAGTASICWTFGFPRWFSTGPNDTHRMNVDHHIAVLWMYVMQPLLFATIGTAIDFNNIPAVTVPKALLVIFVGSLSRVFSSALSCAPAGWNHKELLFAAFSWIPKATVQGALSSAPLDAIQSQLDHNAPNYNEYEQWGYTILATAVISILLTAPIGLLVINLAGPKLLNKELAVKRGTSVRLTRGASIDRSGPTRDIEAVLAVPSMPVGLGSSNALLAPGEDEDRTTHLYDLHMGIDGFSKPIEKGCQVNPGMIERAYEMLLFPIPEGFPQSGQVLRRTSAGTEGSTGTPAVEVLVEHPNIIGK